MQKCQGATTHGVRIPYLALTGCHNFTGGQVEVELSIPTRRWQVASV